MSEHTTKKSRTAYVPTDLALARNQLAIAIKNATTNPTEDNLLEVESAQSAVQALEDRYRSARKTLLASVADKMARRS